MQEAVPVGLGAMAAILGLEIAAVEEIAAELRAASGAEVLPMSGVSGAGIDAVLDRLVAAIGPSEANPPGEMDEDEEGDGAWSPI